MWFPRPAISPIIIICSDCPVEYLSPAGPRKLSVVRSELVVEVRALAALCYCGCRSPAVVSISLFPVECQSLEEIEIYDLVVEMSAPSVVVVFIDQLKRFMNDLVALALLLLLWFSKISSLSYIYNSVKTINKLIGPGSNL